MAYIDDILDWLEKQRMDVSSLRQYAADGDYRSLYGAIQASPQIKITPEGEKWFDLMINNQSAQEARDYDRQMSETDLIRSAAQLEQLGLNPASITDIGGSAYHAGGVVANGSNINVAAQKYAQQQQLARQMIGMVSAMAGAGIHGAALSLAKTSAANIAGDTAITVQHMRNQMKSQPKTRTYYDAQGRKTSGYVEQSIPDYDYSW